LQEECVGKNADTLLLLITDDQLKPVGNMTKDNGKILQQAVYKIDVKIDGK